MFGRYELPLWRKVFGIVLVIVFVYGFVGLTHEMFQPSGATWCWYCQADPLRMR